jgi:hypothetical protein
MQSQREQWRSKSRLIIEAAAWNESERQNLGIEFIAEIERSAPRSRDGS